MEETGFAALNDYLKSRYKTELDVSINYSSIFKVPPMLRLQNPQAYEPYVFSLGPWHYNKQGLVAAEKHKTRSLAQLVCRFADPLAKIKELEEVVKKEADRACECYGGWEDIGVTKEEFEKVLLLDGCFIIEMLRKNQGLTDIFQNECTLFSNAMVNGFFHDLFLMENQIPWFVLELLYQHTEDFSSINTSLVELAVDVFHWIFSYEKLQPQPENRPCKEIKHILDLMWQYLGFSDERRSIDFERNRHNIPSATRLEEAGVKLKRVKSRRLLDVRFNAVDGVLEIPSLLIFPTTETIFRNLICFEQCSPRLPTKVTCYTKLLNGLVDTAEDVKLLSECDNFNNWLNPEDVSIFINKLHDGTNIDALFYADLCEQVHAYCRRLWPKWRAFYIHNYFSKPWAIVSQAFAITILILTILQVYHK